MKVFPSSEEISNRPILYYLKVGWDGKPHARRSALSPSTIIEIRDPRDTMHHILFKAYECSVANGYTIFRLRGHDKTRLLLGAPR